MKITWIMGVLLLAWGGAPGHGDEKHSQRMAEAEAQTKKVLVQGRNLLRAGRYREARDVYDGREWAFQSELFALIDNAKRAGKSARALQLYETYFNMFPLGVAQLSYERAAWEQRALDFVRLLSTAPRLTERERAATEMRALKLYRASEKLRDMETATAYAALARQMASQFPRSVFTLAAVVSAGDVLYSGGNEDAVLRFHAVCLKALQKGGAPSRHRVLVLRQIAEVAELEWTPEHWRIAYDAHRQIELLSDVESEKASALASAAKAMMGTGAKDALARSRTLFYEVLQKYPQSYAAGEARRGIVENFLAARQPDQALKAAHEFEKHAGPSAVAHLLLRIGQSLTGDDDARALPVFEEIARRFARQGAAADANINMAEIYGRRGEDAKMLALYEKVAALKKADVDGGEMYLQAAQSTAFTRLGSYYMKREQWAEALKWWRGYRSGSFCGNCAEAQNSANALRIYRCLSNLGREAEAIQTLEEWTFKPHIESAPGVAVTLVEYYRKRGELVGLESKGRMALQKENDLAAVQMVLEYIELLHARQRQDVAALWEPFEHKSHSTLEYLQWRTKFGAKFLVELGDVAQPFLLKKAPANPAAEHDDASAWACLLLAKMKASAVLPILQANLRTVRDAQELKYRFWALALLGSEESYGILQGFAQRGHGNWRKLAEQVLKTFPPGKPIKFLDSQDALLKSGPGFDEPWPYWSEDK